MRQFTIVVIGLILAALLLGLARPASATGETTALQAFIDAQAATIAALTTRVAAAEATEIASQKRIAALEAWVKAYVPPVAKVIYVPGDAMMALWGPANKAPTNYGAWDSVTNAWVPRTMDMKPSTVVTLGSAPAMTGTLGTAPTFVGPLGTPFNPLSPHP